MTRISDEPNVQVPLINPSRALGFAYPEADFTEAGGIINSDSQNTAGKKKGAILVSYLPTPNRALMIAGGDQPEDPWFYPDGTVLAPAYTANYPEPIPRLGSDSAPNLNNGQWSISATTTSIVTLAELMDVAHSVNLFEFSGKKEGAMIIIEDAGALTFALAMGSLPEDPWTYLGAEVIPTGTPRPPTTVPNIGDGKPVVTETICTSIDFPVIDLADLSDINYTPLYNPGAELSNLHATVMCVRSLNLLWLYYSVVGTVNITWNELTVTQPQVVLP